ncbi:MAG: DUF4118 domain-containing protein [Acidimicrobiia bacterium]
MRVGRFVRDARIAGVAIGLLGVLVLSTAMLPLRGHLANECMALALVIPVLAGSFTGGRIAGVASAIAATLAFDFFFTQPYLSLRITSRNDIATAIALLVLAGISAEIGHRLRRRDRDAHDARAAFGRLCRVAELSARGADLEDVVSSARAELMGLFDLEDCTFETADSPATALRLGIDEMLEGHPAGKNGSGLVLPPGGVALPVTGRGHRYGRLVLYTSRPVQFSLLQRRVAISIADELGLTLAAQPVDDSA